MTIFVDDIYNYPNQGKWCHMMTDSDNIDELHWFANKIGLKREWFQNHPLHPHYDLKPSKRDLAIKNGATAVSRRELVLLTSKVFKK